MFYLRMRKSVETITSGLRTMVDDLRAHAADQLKLAEQHSAAINARIQKHYDALQQAEKAESVAKNIETLLNG